MGAERARTKGSSTDVSRAGRSTFASRAFDGEPRGARIVVQPKLKLGSADDPSEREAESIAAQAVDRGAQGRGDLARHIHRRASEGSQRANVPEDVASDLQAASGGRPLPKTALDRMATVFGVNFGPVRVHTGSQADRLNRQMQSHALTRGRDIFFRAGGFAPETADGRRLLAHELTHVLQQQGSVSTQVPRRSLTVGDQSTQAVVQPARIVSQGPSSFRFVNSNQYFVDHHLTTGQADAIEKSLARAASGRGDTNTLLPYTEKQVQGFVGAVDYEVTEPAIKEKEGMRLVPIECQYAQIVCAFSDNRGIVRSVKPPKRGTVWVKVFFDESKRTVSLAGIHAVE